MMRVQYWRAMPLAGLCLTMIFLASNIGLKAQPADDLSALDAEISELQSAGRYAEALPLAERFVARSKARFGDASAEHATALHVLAGVYFAQSRFEEAEPFYQQALAIREKVLGPHHEDVLSTLDMLASVYRSSRRPHLADPLLRRLLAEEERAAQPDPASIADALKKLAEAETALKRYDEAETHIRRALDLSGIAGNDPAQIAKLLGALAQVERAQGRMENAESTLNRALSLHEKAAQAGDADLLAQVSHLHALVQMAKLSEEMNHAGVAGEMVERVVAMSEKLLGPDHPNVAAALEAVARMREGQGRLAEAEAPRKRAIAINERAYGKEDINVALSLQRLGGLYQLQYRYDEATPLLERGLRIAEAALGPEHPALSDYLANLGELYFFLKRWGETELLMKRALSNLDKAQGLDTVDSAVQAIRILRGLAFVCEAQGRGQDARPFLERALAMSERVLGPDHASTGNTLSALAVHALFENRLDEAERLFERALPISEKAGRDSRGYADTVAGLGIIHFKRENWAKAHEAMKAASAIYVALEQRAAGGASVASQSAGGSRSIPHDQFFLYQAVAAYRLAETDRQAADALRDEAFQLAQRTQSSRAAAALSQMAARLASGEGALAALLRERQDLGGAWQVLDARVTAAHAMPPDQRDAASEQSFRVRLAEITSRIASIDERLAKDFPDYAALASPQPLSIKAAQDVLAPQESLILIASLPNQSLVWVIGKSSARWALVPMGTQELAREVAALRCGLDSAAWEKKGPLSCQSLLGISPKAGGPLPYDLSRAHALYEALFAPFKDLIAGKRLLIAAAGPLAALPFAALVTERPEAAIPAVAARYAGAAWLMRSHAATTLPSVASLASLRLAAKTSVAPKPFIGFGNPLLSGRNGADRSAWSKQSCPKDLLREPMRVASNTPDDFAAFFRGKLANGDVLRRQNPLPETADELCAVARELDAGESDVNLGARATESVVKALNKQDALAAYRIVHFATHGLLAGETESVGGGAEPSLLLTPPATATEADDGLLTASEVAQLKLNADWVVLSACNTAGGQKGGAEALSGLARAFFYAGARALLVSHWYVDSNAAVTLVTQAFAELKRDPAIGRAEALRRAMLAAMNDVSRPSHWTSAAHPSIWAPFVVVGEGGAAQ